MALVTYPLNDIDYGADDAALFHCTRTTGIYAGTDFSASASGSDDIITIAPGIAWMRVDRFKGLVSAMKQEADIDMGLPDSVYPRIERIVLQYDANKNDVQLIVKSGSPSSNPLPPERVTTAALYEIHLYEIRREPGAAAISAKDITDLRLNPDYCGLMAESVTSIDTSAINAQVEALIEQLRAEIEQVMDGAIPDDSVSTEKIQKEAVTPDRLDRAYATLNDADKVTPEQASASIVNKTASFTLSLADAGTWIYSSVTTAITITVPTNTAVPIPIGTEIEFCQFNTGSVTFAAASGVVLVSLDNKKKIAGRYGCAALKKTATNTWILAGALS